MQLIAALRNLLSRSATGSAAMTRGTAGAEHEQVLAELRSLFQDDLADHDRTACSIALNSTSHRARH